MLRPLVHLLIHQGVTYIAFLDLLKRTYVEVADKSFALKTKRQTDSRISLLTGVHRMEVKRIRAEAAEPMSEKEIKASKSAQMMSIWTGHQAYLDNQGKPKALFLSSKEGSPSFEELVLRVSKDKHPRSVLDEWLNQKLITIQDNKVFLNEAGYIPEEDFEEKLFFAGKNIGDHLAIVAHNLAGEQPPLFDRAVYYSDLSQESVELLEEQAKRQMMQLLTDLNQKASELQQQDKEKDDNKYAMHVGGYFFKQEQQDE